MPIKLDHLVVVAGDLEEGIAWAEDTLGVPPLAGGRHPLMGTHNALWGLGSCYLEVIAVDPEAVRPEEPRWFGLDDPRLQSYLCGGPMLATWAVAVESFDAIGTPPLALDGPYPQSRDSLTWEIMLPREVPLPLGGAWPLLIRWTSGPHPADALTDQGLRLDRFEIASPHAETVQAVFGTLEAPAPVTFVPYADGTRLTATIRTRSKTVTL
ncbi:MAG: VOC family protein [Paracoccaceae bacterium]